MNNSLPEIPDYVAKSLNEIKEIGCADAWTLAVINKLLLDWAKKYGDNGYTKTVEWLASNEKYFEQVSKNFLK